MSSLQENLLNSIEILAKSYMQQAPGTTVIEGVIQQIVNAGTGHYIVNYLDNLLDVYANNSNIQFNIGDKVYVLIPNGDFSKQKIIISMSTPSTMIYDSSEMDRYMEVSDNLFYDIKEIELSTYKTEDRKINGYWYSNFSNVFPKYLKNYSTFLFSVDIKTEIKTEQQINGNYGIKLQLPFYFYNSNKEKVETWKTYILDINNISGNPYRLTEWTKQNVFIQLSSEEMYDQDREPQLNVFVKDFAQDAASANIKDIKIKDIGFYVYDILSEDQQKGYYLHLKASEGNYFFIGDETETKILTPTLKANGRNVKLNISHVSIEDTYQCYWFVEDASIKEDSDFYTSIGGIGWRCLNDRTNVVANEDGTTSFDFVTNQYTYSIYAKDVLTSARYKCVIVVVKTVNNKKTYSITVSSILKLENLKASINMSVDSITGSNSYMKNIGEVGLSCTLIDENKDFFNNYNNYSITYEWNRYDKNNKYLDNDFYVIKVNSNKENNNEHIIYQQISLKTSLIEDANIFTCSAYINYVDKYGLYQTILLGTESILINTNGSSTYNLSIQNGDILYKYDVDGDSPLSEKYDGPLDTKVTMIKPLSYTIYKADGTEFTESEYACCKTTWLIPKKSLVTAVGGLDEYDSEYYQLSGTGRFAFNYTLASRYNFKKDNNVIRLKVNYGNIELYADAAIKILKEGENGTNNSKYTAVITHNGAAYGERKGNIIQKFQAIYCLKEIGDDGEEQELKKWYYHNLQNNTLEEFEATTKASQKLELEVYNSNEKINNSDISIEWSFFDYDSTHPNMGFSNGENFTSMKSSNGEGCWIGPNPNCIWKDEESPVNIIQAKVIIKDKETGNSIEIYAYYPIEIIKVDRKEIIEKIDINEKKIIYTIPTCIGGFSSVLYASDGTNPQYNSSEPFTCIDSAFSEVEYKDNYDYKWESSSNLTASALDKDLEKNQINFRPITKYDSSNTKNYIKATLTLNKQNVQNIKEEIQNQKNIYEENIAKKENIETEKQKMSEFLKDAYTKKAKDDDNIDILLEASKPYLQAKAKILNSLNELEKYYNEFLEYYSSLHMISEKIDSYLDYMEEINNLRTLIRKDDDIEELKIDKINLTKTEVIQEVKDNIGNKPKFSKFLFGSRAVTINESGTTQEEEPLNYTSIGSILHGLIASYNDQYDLFKRDYNSYIIQDKVYIQLLNMKYFDIVNSDKLIDETLRNQLNALGARFTVDSDSCAVTYSDILNNIINEAFKLISFYGNSSGDLSEAAKNDFNEKEKQYEENAIAAQKEYNRLIVFLNENEEVITYIRPIVMTYNRYSLSAIAGWDGNRLYTGTGNTGDYLYAPQVGAGVKETDGSFTGVVIGHKKESDKSKIGLFGFNKGVESIFLNSQNGSATFGVSGEGQITIVPGGTSSIAGWQINQNSLSKEDEQIGTVKLVSDPSATVKIDNINRHVAFQASKDNNQAIITYDGWFKSNHGNIGGWTISSNKLSSKNIEINADGSIKHTGNDWSINSDGSAIFKNITAEVGGSIGGWKINGTKLEGGNTILNSSGSMSGPGWNIYSNGNAEFNNISCNNVWSFGSGSNTWTNNGFTFTNGYLGGSGGSYNTVSSSGFAFGNGTIGLGTASDGNNGISYNGQKCTIAGDIYANNGHFKGRITAKSGDIGTWEIDGNGLVKGSTFIYPTGISVAGVECPSSTLRASDLDISFRDLYEWISDLNSTVYSLEQRLNAFGG